MESWKLVSWHSSSLDFFLVIWYASFNYILCVLFKDMAIGHKENCPENLFSLKNLVFHFFCFNGKLRDVLKLFLNLWKTLPIHGKILIFPFLFHMLRCDQTYVCFKKIFFYNIFTKRKRRTYAGLKVAACNPSN